MNGRLPIVLVTLAIFITCVDRSSAQRPQNYSLDQKIGQMLMAGFRGLEADSEDPIARMIQQYHLGGVILFDYDVPADTAVRNIRSPGQVAKLTKDLQGFAGIPLFIAVDQEGGKVARLKPRHGFPATVSAAYLGQINHPDTTAKYAKRTAGMLQRTGINVNLAPVLDINQNPDNPVIGKLGRSISNNPEVVADIAETYIVELNRSGIITALKHFPGHGSSTGDSHHEFVDVTGLWQPAELKPYRSIISKGLADMVMTAHIFNAQLDSLYPATLSEPVINGLLRDSLNYRGVVISDDMQMKAIREYYGLEEAILRSIRAGVDILIFANNTIYEEDIVERAHGIIRKLVEKGDLSPERIDASFQRILALKKKYLITNK